jgi:predicted nucleic acid-binding protein
MSDVIVDSCVVVKYVLAEEDSDQAERFFRSVRGAGDRLIVLDVAVAEGANAVWKQYHRGLITSSDANRFFEDLLGAPVELRSAHRLLQPAFEIAVKYDHASLESCTSWSLQSS